MTLEQWAIKWGIGAQAVADLRREFGTATHHEPQAPSVAKTEGDVQNLVRLEASHAGARLWRNNVGACVDDKGNFIRYGIANDSKRVNEEIKSSDLLGIRPLTITQAHVGCIVGQFMAREIKEPGWSYKGTGREKAQLKFLEVVHALGGDAAFANSTGTI